MKDGDDGGREATRTMEAGGKKEGRRKDCGMDISVDGWREGRPPGDGGSAALEFGPGLEAQVSESRLGQNGPGVCTTGYFKCVVFALGILIS